MSFVIFKMSCEDCKKDWDTSFGIQGSTQIATPTQVCPECGSKKIKSHDDMFNTEWTTTSST